MNSRARSRRRFRVVARPQAKARRARLFGAACAVLLLGAIAAAAARHAAAAWPRARAALPAFAPGASAAPEAAVVDGVAEPLRGLMQAAADAAEGSAGDKAAALARAFPCASDVRVSRAWGEKRSTLTPVLRGALAAALRRGRPAGFLGTDGTVFDAPAGVYAVSGPTADVGAAGADELKALAREWPALTAPGAFPAPLSELAFVSAGDGWQARLTDGTSVQWGRLDWTKEKLARLSEALADARAQAPAAGAAAAPAAFAADLRYFEDGRVLLRPAGPALVAGAHGGVK